MFSIFKKVSDEQEVILQDLTEEQLTQAAGGCDYGYKRNDHDWDDHKMMKHHHKHHHHVHHFSDAHKTWSSDKTMSYSSKPMSYGAHW